MEEKKEPIKVSMSTVFLIIAIIVIAVMGYLMYSQKIAADKKITELENDLTNMQTTVNNLQGEINSATTSNQVVTNKSASFTAEQVKTALSNYLELKANSNCDNLLEALTKKGTLNYNSSEDNILDDGVVITKIKFADYKSAMLNYVSESEFEKNWTSALAYSENSNGYLTKVQGGGSLAVYTVESVNKKSETNYSAKTSYIIDENDSTPAQEENYDFTIKSYNGNCVIDSIK